MPVSWTGQTLHAPHHKRSVRIGQLLGEGGEGSVYLIDDLPQEVAKIYHDPPDAERCEKLGVLASLRHPRVRAVTAMPTGALQRGQSLVGFIMPKVSSRHSAHTCYHSSDRKQHSPKATWAWVIAIARNIAAAVDEIHAAGMIIGDINESGFLVDLSPERQTIVTTIDCDSFQVVRDGRVMRCTVGKPEYTPPELIGRPLSTVVRVAQHDAFGMAVLIYQLLMMARHPFHGSYPSDECDGVSQAIARGWYVFGRAAQQQGVRPPSTTLDVGIAGPRIANLWERAFVGPHADRPTPRLWVEALDHLRGQLVTCKTNHQHQYARHLPECPWCAFSVRHRIDYFPMHLSTIDDFTYSYPLQDVLKAVEATTAWAERHVQYALPPIQVSGQPTDQARIESAAAEAYARWVAKIDQVATAREAYRHWQLAVWTWRSVCKRRMTAYRAALDARKAVIRARLSAYMDAQNARSAAYDGAWSGYREAAARWDAAERRRHLTLLARRDRFLMFRALTVVTAACGVVLTLDMGLSYLVCGSTCVLAMILASAAYAHRDMPRIETPAPPEPPPCPDPIPAPEFPPYPPDPELPWPVQRPPELADDQEPTAPDDASLDRDLSDWFADWSSPMQQREAAAQQALDQAKKRLADYCDGFVSRAAREAVQAENLTNTYLEAKQEYSRERQAKISAADDDLFQDYLDSIPVHSIRAYNRSFPRHLITNLESNGIGTAKDVIDILVTEQVKVSGIGPAYTKQLSDWVMQIVAKQYRRDPNKLLSSSAMQQLVQHHAARKSTIEHGLEKAVTALRRIQGEPPNVLNALVSAVGTAQNSLAAAQRDTAFLQSVRYDILQRLRAHASHTHQSLDRNIHIRITSTMARDGCRLEIPANTAVDGVLTVEVPPGTAQGTVQRIVGAGATNDIASQPWGDVLVTIDVDDHDRARLPSIDHEPDPVPSGPPVASSRPPLLPTLPPTTHIYRTQTRALFYIVSILLMTVTFVPLLNSYRITPVASPEVAGANRWLNRKSIARRSQDDALASRDLERLQAHLRLHVAHINTAPVQEMIAALQAERDNRLANERAEQLAAKLRTAWLSPDLQSLLLFAQAHAGTTASEAALTEHQRRLDAAKAVEAERTAAAERRRHELEARAQTDAWAKAAEIAAKGRAFGAWSEQSATLKTEPVGTDIVRALRDGAEVARSADRMADYAEILADTQRHALRRLHVFVANGTVPKRVADVRLLLGEPMQRNATGDTWMYGDFTMTIEGNYIVQVNALPQRDKR
jgi:DNA-binding helix-hairpin-helix protein with protein kinase domain